MTVRLLAVFALFGLLSVGSSALAQPPERASRAFLGIRGGPQEPGKESKGALVQDVAPGSPAAEAGLKTGDQILKIDDKGVKSFDELMGEVARHKPGDKVKLEVMRDDKEKSFTVTLGQRPGFRVGTPTGRTSPFLGIESRELTPEEKNRLGVTVDAGAVVMDVVPDSPAARAGLERGDVITKIDGKAVANPMDLHEAVRQAGTGKEVTLAVARGKETKDLKAKLEAAPGDIIVPRFPFEERSRGDGLERRLERLEKRVQELEKKENPAK